MLHRLTVANFGLIDRAEIEFAPGATIFTGETGSGKTMLLGALDFVLGARAGPDVVRRREERASVSIVFSPDDALRERLCADGFPVDAGEEATIEREMTRTGRSSLRLNGRVSTAAYAREIGESIAEIVGQHEAQRLLSPSYHLELLDRFAGEAALRVRSEVASAYEKALEAAARYERFRSDEQTARARYEEARFSAQEIEHARIELDEDARLEERRRYLDNVERIVGALKSAHDALTGDDGGALGALGIASSALAHVAPIATDLAELHAQAGALQSETNDLAASVARALGSAEYDPAELERINARLDRLDRLKRKYGGTLVAVRDALHRARSLADEYENRDRHSERLREEAAAAQSELVDAASRLSQFRREAATTLAGRVMAEFAELALGSGRFEVAIDPLDRIAAEGAERAEFVFSASAGEPPRPLAKVASGGERSRVLLALVVALAQTRGSGAALVFDEIDSGIGGATATAVGARIGRLARGGQVACVTHLAQIATWADRHYVLDKTEGKNETTIGVREITTGPEREAEIARMLSGESHDAAIEHARALLSAAR